MIEKIVMFAIFSNFFCMEDIIKGGVYNIEFFQYYLQHNNKEVSLRESFKYPNTFFRIFKNSKYKYYYIENIINNFRMNYLNNREISLNKRETDSSLWKFIKKNNFLIKNKNNCYIKINNYNISCLKIHLEEAVNLI